MASQQAPQWENWDVSSVPKKIPHLVPKGGRFYFRIRIPDDLRAAIGKREHSEALGDVNKAQAEVLAAQLGAQWHARFLSERHALGLAPSPPAPAPQQAWMPREATLDEVRAVAHNAARSTLQADEELRIEGGHRGEDVPGFGTGRPLASAVKDAVSGRDLQAVRMQAEDWLNGQGLALPADPLMARHALYAWAQVMAAAPQGMRLRDEGTVVPTPPAVQMPAAQVDDPSLAPGDKPAHTLRLRDVFELWKAADSSRAVKTIMTVERVVQMFEDCLGNPPLRELTRKDGITFRDHLHAAGMAPRTVADRFGWVTTLLKHELREHRRIDFSPWDGLTVKIPRATEKPRDVIPPELMVALFSSPVFQSYELPRARNAGRDAAYWVPIIGAFTGARITELAQLLAADVFKDQGTWALRISQEEDWQSVKNAPSFRVIPLHPELIRLGLPEYAEAIRAGGNVRLFPLAPVSEVNNAGGALSSWFSGLKAAAGLNRKQTFHSFRHTIETQLKRHKENAFHRNGYLGHKHEEGDSDNTYTHLHAEDFLSTAKLIQHPGLTLPRVFPPPGWAPPPVIDEVLMTRKRKGRPRKGS